MYSWKKFPPLLLILHASFSFYAPAQEIHATPCNLKGNHFTKVISLNDTSLLLIASRENEFYTNWVYPINANDTVQPFTSSFDCFSRSDGNYFLPLKDKLYVCDIDASDGGSYSRFYADHVISGSGIEKDTSAYFFKLRSYEFGKVNSESESYDAVRGIYGEKFLFTYNNDYREQYHEGIRYKILSAPFNVSEMDSAMLPYNDRECNIKKIIYDDAENKIYILCEVFRKVGRYRRVTDHFAVCKFDLTTHTMQEGKAEHMPDSSNCQMVVAKNDIYLLDFQSPKYLTATDSLTMYCFNKQTLELKSVHVNHFDSTFVNKINQPSKKYSFRFFEPAELILVNDTSLLSVYEFRFTDSDLKAKDFVIGAAIATMVTVATAGTLFIYPIMGNKNVPYSGDLLVMNVDSSGNFFPSIIDREPIPRNYNFNSFIPVVNGKGVNFLFNGYAGSSDLKKRIVRSSFFDLKNHTQIVDSISFAKQNINFIFPGSFNYSGKACYFTGLFDDDNDSQLFKRTRYCLIRYRPDE